MEWSLSKVQRVESGDVRISDNDLRPLAALLGLGKAVTRDLLRRNEAARTRGWWHEFRGDISTPMSMVVGMEAEVDTIREYAITVVPALMRTYAYAAAISGSRPNLLRQRQAAVLDREEPPDMVVLIDEATLYQVVGDTAVMADQIGRLAELSRRPGITIRVLPFEAAVHRRHGFLVMEDERLDNVVYADLISGEVLIEYSTEVRAFTDHFAELWEASLDQARTGQLLHRVADGYQSGEAFRPWLWA